MNDSLFNTFSQTQFSAAEMERVMKVCFFDRWTKGRHSLLPVQRELQQYDTKCLLVHTGSWGAEPGRPAEEVRDGLLCRDITYYKTRFIYRVLEREAPQAVVILNDSAIIDRAVILAARRLRIPSLYMMHGILDTTTAQLQLSEDLSNSTLRKKMWEKAKMYLKYVLPNYFYSGLTNDPFFATRAAPYRLVWQTLRNPAKYCLHPPSSQELLCDRAFAWAKVYGDFFREAGGYPLERISIVGHPPLDQLFQGLEKPSSSSHTQSLRNSLRLCSETPICLLLESPYFEQQFTGWTAAVRDEMFQQIADCCRAAGRQLLIKLHPVSTFDKHKFESENPGACVVRDIDLAMLTKMAESVIGFSSTTMVAAVVLRKPLIRPCWGVAAAAPDYYASHGVAFNSASPADLTKRLRDPDRSRPSTEIQQQYLDEYVGPCDGKAIERVAVEIVSAASSRTQRDHRPLATSDFSGNDSRLFVGNGAPCPYDL